MGKKEESTDEVLTRVQRLSKMREGLLKTFGPGVVRMGSDVEQLYRIPSGSLRLDYATSGGFPVRRATTIWGGEGSGKTTVILHAIAEAQRLCAHCYRPYSLHPDTGLPYCDCMRAGLYVPVKGPGSGKDGRETNDEFTSRVESYAENSYEPVVVAYHNIEGDLDLPWARKIGVDVDRLIITDHESGEEAVDVVETMIASGLVDVSVVDSIAMMTPTKELDESSAKALVGKQPLLINRAMRKWTQARVTAYRQFGRSVTPFLINQQRMKIDDYGGGPTQPGGQGQRFVGSIQIRVWAAKGEVRKIDIGKEGEEIHVGLTAVMKFVVEKNKVGGTSGTQGKVEFCKTDCEYGKAGQFAEFDDIVRIARRYGLIAKGEKPGEWFLLGKKHRTEKEVMEVLTENEAIRLSVRRQCLENMLKGIDV